MKAQKLLVKLGKFWQKDELDKCKTQKWWIGEWNEKEVSKTENLKS